MTDTLIRGMEMPKSCYKCKMKIRNGMDFVCPVAHERFSAADVNILDYRLDSCPLAPTAGRLVALDDGTALAIAAGARAIRENKRLVGSKYVYDVFGKNGGPYEISYHEASEILADIWDAYPLPEPSGGDA